MSWQPDPFGLVRFQCGTVGPELLGNQQFSDRFRSFPAVITTDFGLNLGSGVKRDQFIERAAANPIARRVKIADIEDNMDLTRLDSVDESVLENQEKYHRAWLKLQEAEQAESE